MAKTECAQRKWLLLVQEISGSTVAQIATKGKEYGHYHQTAMKKLQSEHDLPR